MRILLVEDEPFIALDLEMMLNSMGHEVIGVGETEAETFLLAEQLRPDAALVDMKLKDGFTGARIAQRLAIEIGVVYAFVTGNPEQIGDTDPPPVAIVRKPFSTSDIAAVVTALETCLSQG